jgi:hypothetical protein
VHSLYRCRCIVGYRPFSSPDIIWFPERQIASVTLNMSWSPDALTMNMDRGGTPATQFNNALSGSTVNITLSDPYMTGASWAVLFDTAAAYTNESLAAANHIILPKCAPGQVSTKEDPCRPISGSSEIEDIGERSAVLARFAHVLVIFYYEVAGVTFSLETYFRVQRFNIVHGKSYPKVTIAGVDPQTITFNQNLQNFQMKENQTLEENLKEVANIFGYRVSFCNSPEANYGQKYIMPAGFREKQVTGEEVLKKYINSVGGTFGKLPTKEYANKISVCTRANVNQGCSVFYLGKGLYEGYQINGQVERDQFNVNAEIGVNRGLGIDYDTKPLDGQKYTLEDTFPEKRKAKLRGAKTSITSFPQQFEVAEKRLFETQITSGYVWRGNGPEVSNTKVQSINFYGVGVNNNEPISLLEGTVQALSRDTGTIMIFTDYVFKVCEKDKQCTIRPIWQEVVNLATIEPILKINDRVSKNVVLGTATAEEKWYTRFFIKVNAGDNTNVTPAPNLVWSYAIPVRDLTDEEKKSAGIKVIEQSAQSAAPSRAGAVVPPAPQSQSKNWSATDTSKPSKVLVMAGHYDSVNDPGPSDEWRLNAELVKWAQRNAQAYGVADFLEFYLPPSRPALGTQWNLAKQAVQAGKQVIEIHNDQPRGSSGVIPPLTTGPTSHINGAGLPRNKIRVLDDALAKVYGAFERDHRSKPGEVPLGIPNRGGTILEVGRMDTATVNIASNGTPAQKEALYKQLMDPFMRSVAAERARTAGSAATPSPSSSTSTYAGRIGSTGSSTGPHLHAEWGDYRTPGAGFRREITVSDVAKYITFNGQTPGESEVAPGGRFGDRGGGHKGVDLQYPAGTVMRLKGGATLGPIIKTGCPPVSTRCNSSDPSCCGGGFGNHRIINTPEGPMLLAHLQEGSLESSESGDLQTADGSSSRSSKYGQGVQNSPVPVGVSIETEFKGIPRALRIVPGRTILSFVTEYDKWIEEGRPDTIDPGVWIPERFSAWMIKSAEYRWNGDLRVKVSAVSDWGVSIRPLLSFPKFKDYLVTENFKYKDYYGYIRGLGDLCWTLGNGKNSCDERCKEAEEIREYLQRSKESEQQARDTPSSVTSEFPPANCPYIGTKYPKDRVNAIINAARQAGINNKSAYAGIIGNVIQESRATIDPAAFNKNKKYLDAQGRGCIGIMQWCDRKKNLVEFARSQGKSEFDFGVQVAFFNAELTPGNKYFDSTANVKSPGGNFISAMNAVKTPEEGALLFNIAFERALGQEDKERQQFAREVFNDLQCS